MIVNRDLSCPIYYVFDYIDSAVACRDHRWPVLHSALLSLLLVIEATSDNLLACISSWFSNVLEQPEIFDCLEYWKCRDPNCRQNVTKDLQERMARVVWDSPQTSKQCRHIVCCWWYDVSAICGLPCKCGKSTSDARWESCNGFVML